MKNKTLYYFLIVMLAASKLNAQQVEKGFELLEITKIGEVYKQSPNLSFTVTYTYADSAQPSTILEQMTGESKMSDGRYWSMMDSVEFVQGYQYNLTVYHHDSTLVVNDPQIYPDVMKLPTLDSLFEQQVDSLQLVEWNDSTRQLSVFFNGTAPYGLFKIRYDKNSFLIRGVDYYIKNVPTVSGVTSGTALITVTYSNYSESSIDPSVFLEDRFIYKLNNELYTKPAFAGYKLFSNISTKSH